MKVSILVPTYWPSYGGIELVSRLIAQHLARQGHQVTVLTSQMKTLAEGAPMRLSRVRNFPENEMHHGVHIRRFPSGGGVDFALGCLFVAAFHLRLPMAETFFEWHWLRRLRARRVLRAMRSDPPEVLLVMPCTDWLLQMGLQAARATGARLVFKTSLHLSPGVLGQRRLGLLAACDAVIASTAFEADALVKIGVPPDRVHQMPEPLDLEARNAITPAVNEARLLALENKKFVLFLGRKEREKGIGSLVDAFISAPPALAGVSLVLAGGSTDYFEAHVRTRAEKCKAILILDHIDDPAKMWLLKHCAVFSMVSSIDSFGLVYLEAWLSGAPVVAADVPAMRCVIRDGVDGLLVPYGDVTRLQEALSRLISDRDAAQQMAKNGQEKVLGEREDFAVEKKVETILKKLL